MLEEILLLPIVSNASFILMARCVLNVKLGMSKIMILNVLLKIHVIFLIAKNARLLLLVKIVSNANKGTDKAL